MTPLEIIFSIISALGVVGTILFAYMAFRKSDHADTKHSGERDGTILTEIGYIKSGVDDIKHKQEKFDQQHLEVVEKLAKVEASVAHAHERIDTLAARK